MPASEGTMQSGAPQILASWLIGSGSSCDIVVKDSTVSGQHCRLTKYERQFTVEDMGSTNGTYVDGIRITPRSPVIVAREQQGDTGTDGSASMARSALVGGSSRSAGSLALDSHRALT